MALEACQHAALKRIYRTHAGTVWYETAAAAAMQQKMMKQMADGGIAELQQKMMEAMARGDMQEYMRLAGELQQKMMSNLFN